MSSSLGAWSRALAVVLGLLCALATILIVLGVVLVVADERRHTDDWDGLGTAVGLVLGGFAAVLLVVLGALLALTLSGRRRGSRARLAWAGGLAVGLAGTFLVAAATMVLTFFADPSAAVMVGLPAFALAVPAAGTLVALQDRDRAPTTGGWPPTG